MSNLTQDESAGDNQSKKITISLFHDDDERLTSIQASISRLGRRVSVSQIIRLSLRSLPVTDTGTISDETAKSLISILDSMKDEDGRVKRYKK